MVQYNISLFIDHAIEKKALIALNRFIIPELLKDDSIEKINIFEIKSHQEPDSKGFSIQFILPNLLEEKNLLIEELLTGFFAQEFPNQYVYFPSVLKLIDPINGL